MAASQTPGTPGPETTPPATPASTPPPETPPTGDVQAWLKPRLEQATRSGAASAEKALLAELGITDRAQAKALLATARQTADAQKTELQRATERVTALEADVAQKAIQDAVLTKHASRQLGALSAEQQAVVKKIAGEDPARQLDVIDELLPTWGKQPAPPVAEPKPSNGASTAAPEATGSTAPPNGAPSDTSPTSASVNHKQVYEELKKDPRKAYQAGQYFLAHRAEIYPQR